MLVFAVHNLTAAYISHLECLSVVIQVNKKQLTKEQ